MVLEKTLESPLDCKESQPILKEVSPKYSLEGLMLKLKLQYLMRRIDSLEKTLMLEKIEGGRKRGRHINSQSLLKLMFIKVRDTIQLSHSLSPLSSPGLSFSHHQGLFQYVVSSHQVAKVLEL